MKLITDCPNCGTKLIIIENLVLNSEDTKLEKALCTICMHDLYSATISGWFFVQKEEYNLTNKSESCYYPMP